MRHRMESLRTTCVVPESAGVGHGGGLVGATGHESSLSSEN